MFQRPKPELLLLYSTDDVNHEDSLDQRNGNRFYHQVSATVWANTTGIFRGLTVMTVLDVPVI